MAQRTNRSNRASGAPRPDRRRRAPAKKGFDFSSLFRKKHVDFKPDSEDTGILKKLYITQAQRDVWAKWGAYVGVLLLLLIIQDIIMSRVTIFGGTTDLVAGAILLITIMEGIESGSLFVIISSILYYFSGSAPGPYCVALLTILGIIMCIFRQLYWHRGSGSIVFCTSVALMVYEIATYGLGLFLNLTRWDRIGVFLVTGGLTCLTLIPLYSLINVIGQIGGNTWKE